MSLVRVPIAGWSKCVYEAAAFDSNPEFCAAKILDADTRVDWWFRNDPVQVRIPTPAGYLEPDFIYSVTEAGLSVICILEVKGEHLWNGPGSVPRVKAAGAVAWTKAIEKAQISPEWRFYEVLGQDVESSHTLKSMLDKAVECSTRA